MSKIVSFIILFGSLVLLPVACSFKKDPATSAPAATTESNTKANWDVKKSEERPDLFAIIAKGDVTKSIEVLDGYTVAELDVLRDDHGTVLDAVLKTESDALTYYILGRGIKPYRFNYENFIEQNLELSNPMKRYMGLLMDKVDNDSKEGLRGVNEENFSQAACVYYVQYLFDKLNVQSPHNDAGDVFVDSARRVFQSDYCRASLETASSEVFSMWGRNELLRQIQLGFPSTNVLKFLDNLVSDFPIYLNMPYKGYSDKADPRIALFMNPIPDTEWTKFMDEWWPLLDKHTPKRKKGWVYVEEAINGEVRSAHPNRVYKNFYITSSDFRICLDSNMENGPEIMQHFGVKEDDGVFNY